MYDYESIKDTVRDTYGGTVTGADLEIFSARLYNTLGSLKRVPALYSEIFSCEYEAGIESEDSCAWSLFDALIPLLPDGKETAQKLYDCFSNELDDPAVFVKLVLHNAQYLTEEQFLNVKDKALKVFDRQFLKGVII